MEQAGEPASNAPEEAPKETVLVKEQPTVPAKELLKRSKKEDRQHKKEDRAIEQFLKSLDRAPSVDEKLTILSRKFSEVAEENRRLQAFIKQSDKRSGAVAKEKEQLQLEYNRTVLVKCKLENLCRELQKQNKSIKEESLLKIREEEERRKETQGKFQSALSEITAMLQQNNDKNAKLREDNFSMNTKFRGILEKYELREQQVEKMAKQMALEQQLADAKLAKAALEAQAERERLGAEIAQLKLELGQYHARIVENQGTETSLRGQLAVYTDKYDEFQSALVKSNQVFGGFKGEMEKMSKKIVKLEKECMSWKKRWETSQVAMLEMATDKRLFDERAGASERQLAQMQRLCRSMQAERNILLNTLKEHNIERPPLPVLPPAPPAPVAAPPASSSKVDAMAANCAQLKQSLAQLQNQLNVLTTKKEEENQAKVEPAATGKSKKGKGKKSKADKEKAAMQERAASNGISIEEEAKAVELTVNENVEKTPVNVPVSTEDESNKDKIDASLKIDNTTEHTNDIVSNGTDSSPADNSKDVDKTSDGALVNGDSISNKQVSDNITGAEASEPKPCESKDSALSPLKPDEKFESSEGSVPTPVLEVAQKTELEQS